MVNNFFYRRLRFFQNFSFKKNSTFAVLFFVIVVFPCFTEIGFSGLDLSGDNQLLFRAGSGYGSYVQDALFLSRLTTHELSGVQQLSAYPEKMDLLENGRVLQIRNAFGAVRVPLSGGLPMPIPFLPSFAGGSLTASGRAEETAFSADGRWLLYLDLVSAALGNLVMVDVLSGVQTQVASRLERPEKTFPASWSPDSRFFVYEREGKLYYYAAASSSMPSDERIRYIGEGTVNSISWSRGGDFYYLRGSTLYRVRGAELFARALYADFLEIGAVAGKIPFEFDPSYDNFWIAPGANSLIVSKGNRSLFFFPLGSDDGRSETTLPYLMLPRSCSGVNVFWSAEGIVTVFVTVLVNSVTKVNVWRLDLTSGKSAAFESLPPPDTRSGSFPLGSLSPDGNLALFWGPGGVLLYDYVNWKLLDVLSVRSGITCLWAGSDDIITGDDEKIERIRLNLIPGDTVSLGIRQTVPSRPYQVALSGRETICLSRANQFGFEERTFRILARGGDSWYVTDGRAPWAPIENPRLRSASQVSALHRVYLERQGPGLYTNLPMVRNTDSVGTYSLFPPSTNPDAANVLRGGSREIALCFDLYDDDQGLPEVLDALKRFGIKASFFLNGEFIRRHPLAVSEIAAAGHETASMFFALFDLSDARYKVGDDFIPRGLARNEDEFYRVTGKELSLLWHPPWYTVSPDIAASAARAGYVTSGRDIDPMDWVSRDDEKRLGLLQRSPSEMIDFIMGAVKPGCIIPVRLGLLPGGRNDYLFNRVNVLLDALIRDGYTLTTVSKLLEKQPD